MIGSSVHQARIVAAAHTTVATTAQTAKSKNKRQKQKGKKKFKKMPLTVQS
jgi:hypothetical protein